MVAPYALCPQGLLDAPSQRNPIPETTQKETTLGKRGQKGRPALLSTSRDHRSTKRLCFHDGLRTAVSEKFISSQPLWRREIHHEETPSQDCHRAFLARGPRNFPDAAPMLRMSPDPTSTDTHWSLSCKPGAALGTLTNPPSLSSQQPGGSPLLSPCSAGPGAHWDLTKSPTPRSGTLNRVAVRSQKKE